MELQLAQNQVPYEIPRKHLDLDVLRLLGRCDIDLSDFITNDVLDRLIKEVNRKREDGYDFASASESFKVLTARIARPDIPQFFAVRDIRASYFSPNVELSFVVTIEKTPEGRALTAQGRNIVTTLGNALINYLRVFYASLDKLVIEGSSVQTLVAGRPGATRVVVVSTNDRNRRRTLGVADDPVFAALRAICDALDYELLLDQKFIRPAHP